MVFFESLQIIFQLFLAAILGGLLGLEREFKKKEAGLQTYSLATLGSCIFTLISFKLFYFFLNETGINFDPSRVIQAVAMGIGFIAAGVIFRQTSGTIGLTTAAGLWVAASIGIAIGAQFYFIAVVATILTLIIFVGFGLLEQKAFKQ